MHDDPYILEDMIACGPSAKVYRGHDLNSERTVRLKVLMDNHVSCPVRHAEIEGMIPVLLSLRHANVSSLLELNVHGDDVTMVTEFAAGVNLWTFLRQQRPLSAADIRCLCNQLLMAVAAGEELGLHHGDVKPSNVIISDQPDGMGYTLQLQDWGEAACRQHQPAETLTYRAPELLEGGRATITSDLFSVGATLATLVLGHAPVHAGNLAQLRAGWATFDPMVLRCRRPDLDPAVHLLLGRLLRYHASSRPQSAHDALRLLAESITPSLPGSVTRPGVYIAVPPPTMTLTGKEEFWDQEAPTTEIERAPVEKKKMKPRRGFVYGTLVTSFKIASLTAVAGIGYAVWMSQNGEQVLPRHWQRMLEEKWEELSSKMR